MNGFTVGDFFNDTKELFSFSLLGGEDGMNRSIIVPELNDLGLSLCGHFAHFPAECIQLYGDREHSYLEAMTPENRYKALNNIMASFPRYHASS